MRCFESYKGDRICDICEISNKNIFKKCKNKYDLERELNQKLREIESKCPYKTDCNDEYTYFTGCNKNGNGYGRSADECRVTLKCEEYMKIQ